MFIYAIRIDICFEVVAFVFSCVVIHDPCVVIHICFRSRSLCLRTMTEYFMYYMISD